MVALPSYAAITDVNAKKPEMIPVFGAQRDFVAALLGAGAPTELTIAAGEIVPIQAAHSVDTEGDAASDNLDNISVENLPDGWLLLLTPANAARVVTLRHDQGGDGEIILTGGTSFALDHAGAFVLLRLSGIQWIEVLAFNGNRLVTSANGRSLIAAADYAAMRTLLGLVLGTNVQAYHANLAAFAGLSLVADRLPYADGAGTLALATFSAAARALLDDADAAAMRTTLGLAIGTNVQAYHANLAAVAGLTLIADRLPYANGSGTLALATLTAAARALLDDADAPAMLVTLGALALAGGSMTGALTLNADPSSALHAATKQYVDNVAAGLDVKPSARVATTANITLSGTQTIDGVSAIAADRVLVRAQTAPAENGLYVVAAGAWSRVADMDAWAEVPGAHVWVEEGSTYADSAWVCSANAGGTLGTTAITWVQFGGTGLFQALHANLTAFAGLSLVADRLPYANGAGTLALATFTAFARTLLDDADAATMRITLGLVIGTDVQAYDVATAKLNVEDQTLTGGARVTSKDLGTVSSGTVTPDPGDRSLQHYTNGGAHTLAPGSNTGAYLIDITNNGSAGAITTSGWTKVAGDAFTTTNGHKFRCHASVGNGGSLLIVQALQ